jgi:predicted DNA-binding transcriptional regulator AlpA
MTHSRAAVIAAGGQLPTSGLLDPLLDAKTVKRDLGNISTMCLWRWARDRAFPNPDLTMGGRRFWHRSTVQSWIEAQKEDARREPPSRRPRVGVTRASRSDTVAEPTAFMAMPPVRVDE